MKPLLKKAALSAVAAGVLTGVSMDASAIITGAVGEALLVPLVVAGDGVNTVITVVTPSVVGNDTVPNYFTAPNTTPGAGVFPGNKGTIHWYFFDYKSVHVVNKPVPVTPDDHTTIDWSKEVIGSLRNQPGYLVIANETARPEGGEASFDMYGDAQLILESPVTAVADIPVLPMSDGVDATPCVPVMDNQVCYTGANANRVPSDVSPLAAGVRLNWQDGVVDALTLIDLDLNKQNDTVHVLWLDGNYEKDGYDALNALAYDDDENPCSLTVPAPYELNIIQVLTSGTIANDWPFATMPVENLCAVPGSSDTYNAFLRVTLPEVIDGTPAYPVAQSGVFFSLLFRDVKSDLDLFTVPAGELGIFCPGTDDCSK